MADIRINALATTAASTASDDFVAVDGSANGTRKLNAFSPTFGGNLTVSGTGNLGGGTAYTTGVTVKPATNDYQVTLLQSNSNSAGWGLLADTSGNLKLTRYGASVYGTAALTFDLNGAATFNSSTTTTVGGNLTVSGTASALGNITFANSGSGIDVKNTSSTAGAMGLYGGNAYNTGAGISLYGSTHATLANVIQFTNGGFTEQARITSGGNVLLNRTVDAGYRLDVSGTARFTFGGSDSYLGYGANNDIYLTHGSSGKFVVRLANGNESLQLDSSANATFAGNIKTAAPSGGTAATWRLGTVASVSPTSPNRTIEVEIGGTTYYIHAKTTNN